MVAEVGEDHLGVPSEELLGESGKGSDVGRLWIRDHTEGVDGCDGRFCIGPGDG
jgi:hypothetical protein